MAQFEAVWLALPDHIHHTPCIIDRETNRYVGFISENGNHELAAAFSHRPEYTERFTWHPIPEGAMLS